MCAVLLGCHGPAVMTADAFPNRLAALSACLDVQDALVDHYADEYLAENGEHMVGLELTAFHDGWGRELAARGTFDRFQAACVDSLTPARARCAVEAQSSDGVIACLRLFQ